MAILVGLGGVNKLNYMLTLCNHHVIIALEVGGREEMKNNIKQLLKEKAISINKLAEELGMSYSPTHALVNRKDLSHTPILTLVKVAEILDVDVPELYEN